MIAELIIFLGSLCFLIASIGLFRMPDPFSRIHAATKASSLGVLLLAIGALLYFRTGSATFFTIAMVFLVFFTAPMACHAISQKLLPGKDDQK